MLIQLAGTRRNRRTVRRPRKNVSYAKAAKFILLWDALGAGSRATPRPEPLAPPQVNRLVGGLLADAAAGVLQEDVVQAGLAHLQARDLHPVPVQLAQEGR